jgi:uncharacterized membrane protein
MMVDLPERERRCSFVEFDFASFEAAILAMILELVETIDDDMSDLYVRSTTGASQSRVIVGLMAGREPENWKGLWWRKVDSS